MEWGEKSKLITQSSKTEWNTTGQEMPGTSDWGFSNVSPVSWVFILKFLCRWPWALLCQAHQVSALGGMEWQSSLTAPFPGYKWKVRIQLPQGRNISAVMSKEARVPSKSLEKRECAWFLSLHPVSYTLTFLLQSSLSKWGFFWPFPMPVHLEQHRLPIACTGGLSGTSFCSLMKSNGMSGELFWQSPENAMGSQCWEWVSFPWGHSL